MTYGWAILIIAVVLAVLFQMGIFNPSTFAPRAQPGSCKVLRPLGPGTTFNINLMGTCGSQTPQYTAQFNGQSSYVSIPTTPGISGSSSVTVSSWVNVSSLSNTPAILQDLSFTTNMWVIQIYIHSNGQVEADFGGTTPGWIAAGLAPSNALMLNVWDNVVATWQSGSGISIYINGVPQTISYVVGSATSTGTLGVPPVGAIGACPFVCVPPSSMSGSIANVQIYNTSLTTNEVQVMYAKGMGGTPLVLQNLVGWWPLNGDTKDYSGNGNDGTPTNVIFTHT